MNARKCLVALAATAALGGGLATAPAATADPRVGNIAVGSYNHHGVWCVQAGINAYYHKAILKEDGLFGRNTLGAVNRFQRDEHIRVDGIVGPQTGSHIWEADGFSSYCYRYLPTVY